MRAHGTLIAWLREQLDQEERLARACIPDNGHGQWSIDRERAYSSPALADSGIRMISGWEPVLPHIATWDPARVLAEVKAKRAIIDLHTGGPVVHHCEHWIEGKNANYRQIGPSGYCDTMLTLAEPYVGRDGWLDEWGC